MRPRGHTSRRNCHARVFGGLLKPEDVIAAVDRDMYTLAAHSNGDMVEWSGYRALCESGMPAGKSKRSAIQPVYVAVTE